MAGLASGREIGGVGNGGVENAISVVAAIDAGLVVLIFWTSIDLKQKKRNEAVSFCFVLNGFLEFLSYYTFLAPIVHV